MHLYDVYKESKIAVQLHPQLRTFAVIHEFSDIILENLQKTSNAMRTPFFYSKDWYENGKNFNEISYQNPSLLILERGGTLDKIFTGRDRILNRCRFILLKDMNDLSHPEHYALCTKLLFELLGYVQHRFNEFKTKNSEILITQSSSESMKMVWVHADLQFYTDCIEYNRYWEEPVVDDEGPVNILYSLTDHDGLALTDHDGSLLIDKINLL